MFAIKFLTYALRKGICHQFGNDAMTVLTIVATTEDRVHYSKAPQFWWDHFQSQVRITRNRLSAVLKHLSESGWLHYEPGNKWATGRYWVLCPTGDDSINAEALGETDKDRRILSTGSQGIESDTQTSDQSTGTDTETNGQSISSRTASHTANDTHSIPIPNPLPLRVESRKKPDEPADAGPPSGQGVSTQDSLEQVVEAWNAVAPVRCEKLTDDRRRKLNTRLRDAWWRENWRQGLARVPAARFLHGENDRRWKADFDFFVQPGSLAKILEGKYDTSGRSSRTTGPRVHRGDLYEPGKGPTAADFGG